MPAPTNTTRGTATDVGALPASLTSDRVFGATTYEGWWKFTASFSGVVGIWGYGGNGSSYVPECDVYENNDAAVYLSLAGVTNVPLYMPVTAGNTYYLNFYMVGSPYVDPALLTLSILIQQQGLMQAGDFLTNMEVDSDAEYPLCVLDGATDHTVRRYEQLASPADPRGQTGMPHGERGFIFDDGHFGWADEQYPNVKIYDRTFALVTTIVLTDVALTLGISRTLQRLYVIFDAGATNDINAYDTDGVQVDTWATTITSPKGFAVNGAETILYYSQGGASAIKRWDLSLNVAMSDLVADTAGYEIQDLLYLEDDTILAVFLEEATTPRDVYVKQYNTSGTVLNTYQFTDLWRSELNPPRIGFALDSPTSFWICLKPQSNFEISEFRNITIATGATAATVSQTNYLEGEYIGDETQTPTGRFGTEKAFPVLVAPLASLDIDTSLDGPAGLTALRDNGRLREVPIRRRRTGPIIFDKNQRLFFSRFELFTQAGFDIPGSGQGSDPVVALDWTPDAFTWSEPRVLNVGKSGQYAFRCYAHQLGSSRQRAFRVTQTDPVPTVWIGADVDIQEGEN